MQDEKLILSFHRGGKGWGGGLFPSYLTLLPSGMILDLNKDNMFTIANPLVSVWAA